MYRWIYLCMYRKPKKLNLISLKQIKLSLTSFLTKLCEEAMTKNSKQVPYDFRDCFKYFDLIHAVVEE